MRRAMNLAGLVVEEKAHWALDDAKNITRLLPFVLGHKRLNRQ